MIVGSRRGFQGNMVTCAEPDLKSDPPADLVSDMGLDHEFAPGSCPGL